MSECHSTNDIAADLIKQSAQLEGTTIITENQTQGRGQRGNQWEAEAGKNATFSIILRPTIVPIQNQFQLHLITTLAIYNSLFPILGKELKIKWPNDIYYKDRKLGGILIENSIKGHQIEHSIIGIGLNLNQSRFHYPRAISILDITNKEIEVNEMIEKIIIELEKKYLMLKQGQLSLLKSQYLRRLYQFNEENYYESMGHHFKGKIVMVDDHGLLHINEGEITHKFAFKEVTYL